MTTRERSLLIAGLFAGIILGAIAYWMVASRQSPTGTAATPPATAPTFTSSQAGMSAPGAEIELAPSEREAIGLKTYAVSMMPIGEELRTVGRVEQAETQLSTISARVGGRLDKLFIGFTGQPVQDRKSVV